MKKGGKNYVLVPKVICSSLLQLTPGSHGLFEAEKKSLMLQAEQIHKMTKGQHGKTVLFYLSLG